MNGAIVLEIASATGEKELPVFNNSAKNRTISVTLAGGTSFIQVNDLHILFLKICLATFLSLKFVQTIL
jgi:hypothetical protein